MLFLRSHLPFVVGIELVFTDYGSQTDVVVLCGLRGENGGGKKRWEGEGGRQRLPSCHMHGCWLGPASISWHPLCLPVTIFPEKDIL